MKKIAYLITDNGIDGREKTNILFASWDEKERNEVHEHSASRNWQSREEQIVDVDVAYNQALSKLNGIDRLVLGIAGVHSAVKRKTK